LVIELICDIKFLGIKMKTFPTLYSRDTLGNIRIWYMEQEENKFRAVSGLQDGEKVTSEWTVTVAKNEGKKNATTAIEQATKEIEAKYKKQKKTGYFENLNDVDTNQYVEPMLAKLYKDYFDKIELSKGNWLLQCKLNGTRCVATKNGLFTRKGEKYISVPHIENALKTFFEKHPDAVLDGELFNNELRQQLNEISKLVRKTVHITQEDLEKSQKFVHYYIYDGYGFGLDKEYPYHERKQWIDANIIGKYVHVMQVEDFDIKHQDDLDAHYQRLVDQGHEGVILRKKDMPYENKRTKNLLKVKPEDDDEAVIIDIQEGTGNWSGTGKIITLNWGGKIFDATFKGTHEQGVDFWKNKSSWIGKTVTFLYNGLTGKGTPNFARVDINNCLKGDR
jgi:DNA ligase-1